MNRIRKASHFLGERGDVPYLNSDSSCFNIVITHGRGAPAKRLAAISGPDATGTVLTAWKSEGCSEPGVAPGTTADAEEP
jgi:hypothetical protein